MTKTTTAMAAIGCMSCSAYSSYVRTPGASLHGCCQRTRCGQESLRACRRTRAALQSGPDRSGPAGQDFQRRSHPGNPRKRAWSALCGIIAPNGQKVNPPLAAVKDYTALVEGTPGSVPPADRGNQYDLVSGLKALVVLGIAPVDGRHPHLSGAKPQALDHLCDGCALGQGQFLQPLGTSAPQAPHQPDRDLHCAPLSAGQMLGGPANAQIHQRRPRWYPALLVPAHHPVVNRFRRPQVGRL